MHNHAAEIWMCCTTNRDYKEKNGIKKHKEICTSKKHTDKYPLRGEPTATKGFPVNL